MTEKGLEKKSGRSLSDAQRSAMRVRVHNRKEESFNLIMASHPKILAALKKRLQEMIDKEDAGIDFDLVVNEQPKLRRNYKVV